MIPLVFKPLVVWLLVCFPPDMPVFYSIESIIADLKSPERAQKVNAIAWLNERSGRAALKAIGAEQKSIVELLIPMLDDPYEVGNVAVIFAECGPHAKSAVPHLLKFIRKNAGNVDRAHFIQWVLGEIGPEAEAALPDLIQSFQPFYFGNLDRKDYHWDMPKTLYRIGPKNAVVLKRIRQGLTDVDIGVQSESAIVLWKAGERSSEYFEIWKQAIVCDHDSVRINLGLFATELSATDKRFITLFLSALREPESGSRVSVILATPDSLFENPNVRQAYMELLDHAHDFTRERAAIKVGRYMYKDEKAVSKLVAMLNDPERDVRVHVAIAVYRINPQYQEKVLEILESALDSDDVYAQMGAVKTMGKMGAAVRSRLPRLRQLLKTTTNRYDLNDAISYAIRLIEE